MPRTRKGLCSSIHSRQKSSNFICFGVKRRAAATMEARSKVAAETAAVVPFHCVICFDSFCLRERLPVVLPCGHTFVCQPCSKRLKRCMECREPLYYNIPKSSSNAAGGAAGINHPNALTRSPQPYSRTGAGRYSPTPSTPPQNHPHHHQHPPPAVTQVPYPIPKNVVLISMMEVAERQAREKVKMDETNRLDDTTGSMDDEEEYDLNRIISGMATVAGPCGTYVVKDPEGLALLTGVPGQEHYSGEPEPAGPPAPRGEDGRQPDETADQVTPALSVSASEDSIEVKPPSLLEKGQTVQVVSFENGVAKLARGAGYILANSSQLVKIGGPLENSCRLEGILDTIVHRGVDLQKELDENSAIEESIRQEIEAEFQNKPNHPIVSDVPKTEEQLFVPVENSNSKEAREPSTPTGKSIDSNSKDVAHTPGTPDQSPDSGVTFNNVREIAHPAATFPFSPNSIDNADLSGVGLPAYRRNTSLDYADSFGCGATSFLGTHVRIFSDDEQAANSPLRFTDGNENRLRSSSADGDGGNSQPYLTLTPTLTSSFDTVDFRTGLSGHRGLTNAKKSNILSSPNTRRRQTRMMMSEHRGIGRVRGPFNRSAAPNTPSP